MQRARYINIARAHARRDTHHHIIKPWVALLILVFAFLFAGSIGY